MKQSYIFSNVLTVIRVLISEFFFLKKSKMKPETNARVKQIFSSEKKNFLFKKQNLKIEIDNKVKDVYELYLDYKRYKERIEIM